MAFNAAGYWTPEDDDVQTQVQKVVSDDGALMKQARGVGTMMAAKRGLGNSSIAIGASQGEVLKQATAIGGQNAGQIAGRNLAKLNQVEETARATGIASMQIEAQKALQAGDLASRERISQMEMDNSLKLQNGEITFKAAQAEQERINSLKLQANELASKTALTERELGSRESISQAELKAAMDRQAASEAASAERQKAEIAAGALNTDKTIAASAADRAATIASQEKLANTDTQTRLTIAEADRAAQAKQTAINATTTLAAAHMQASAAVMNNPDIPSDARAAYAASIQKATEANIGLVEQITGVDLQWGNNVQGTGAPGSYNLPAGAVAQNDSGTSYNDSAGVQNYKQADGRWLRIYPDGRKTLLNAATGQEVAVG